MSVDWLSKAWKTTVGSPTRKAVLIALADRCGEEGICWPSYRDIMARTELGRTTVQESISDLVVDGFVEYWDRERPDGSSTSKGYRLTIPDIAGGSGSRTGGAGRRTGGRPAAGPRTEPSVEPSGEVLPRRRSATSSAGRSRSRFQPKQADDTTDVGDEPPALGASPKRKTQAEVDVAAADRGTSGRGLAVRLRDGLDASDLPVSARIVDVGLLGKRLNELHRKGMTRDVQAKCVELYVANPGRYKAGDTKGWTGFLEALPKLEADAAKHVRADAGGAAYNDPYAGVDE